METVGGDANKTHPSGLDASPATNGHDDGHLDTDQSKKPGTAEPADHHGAEGEEMVEGEEDNVIY